MTSLCYQKCIGVPSRIYYSAMLRMGWGSNYLWHQHPICHPHDSSSDQLWGLETLISPLWWGPSVVKSTGRIKSRHIEMSSVRTLFYTIKSPTNLFPSYFHFGKTQCFIILQTAIAIWVQRWFCLGETCFKPIPRDFILLVLQWGADR